MRHMDNYANCIKKIVLGNYFKQSINQSVDFRLKDNLYQVG